MRDRWLRQFDARREIAYACLVAGVTRNHTEQLEPTRIRKRFQLGRQLGGGWLESASTANIGSLAAAGTMGRQNARLTSAQIDIDQHQIRPQANRHLVRTETHRKRTADLRDAPP